MKTVQFCTEIKLFLHSPFNLTITRSEKDGFPKHYVMHDSRRRHDLSHTPETIDQIPSVAFWKRVNFTISLLENRDDINEILKPINNPFIVTFFAVLGKRKMQSAFDIASLVPRLILHINEQRINSFDHSRGRQNMVFWNKISLKEPNDRFSIYPFRFCKT